MNRFRDRVLRNLIEATQRPLSDRGRRRRRAADGKAARRPRGVRRRPERRRSAATGERRRIGPEAPRPPRLYTGRFPEVVADVRDVDVAFIDRDHNCFNVYQELNLLDETALNDGSVAPFIALALT